MNPVACGTFLPVRRILQPPFDVAVVIPTVIRPTLARAVRSVFGQRFAGRVQILIGIDLEEGDPAVLSELERECPPHQALTLFDLGYSTCANHGGLYPAWGGGALRTILSYAAHSRRIAYLDDDNWWAEDHLQSLCDAIAGRDWAFSLRWYVEAATGQPLCVDAWESVGPGAGIFNGAAGGFVDPSTLMIDKIACEPVLRLWTVPSGTEAHGRGEDRHVFNLLSKGYRWGATGRATTFYTIYPADAMHPYRLKWLGQNLPVSPPT